MDTRKILKKVVQAQLDAYLKRDDKDFYQQAINDLQTQIFLIEQDIAINPPLPPDYDPNNLPQN